MTEESKYIGASEFADITGLSRQSFYKTLKAGKKAGAIEESEKKLDLENQWVKNYMIGQGRGQRQHVTPDGAPAPLPPPRVRNKEVQPWGGPKKIPKKPLTVMSASELPDLADLTHYEAFEKVKKLQIDNATKAGTVIARDVVLVMIDKIEEAFVRIIVDGESALVPDIIEKSRKHEIKDGRVVFVEPPENIYKLWRKEIQKYIKPVKAFMVRELKKYDRRKGFDA